VSALLPTIIVQSRELGAELGLPELPESSEDALAWLLFRDATGLALRRDDGVHIRAEFVHGRSATRAREASLAGQPLAKALGIARLARHADAKIWLKDCAESASGAGPQVVYLDPMYPAQRRRARSRKGIESLHALVPPGEDEGLLDAALMAATLAPVISRL